MSYQTFDDRPPLSDGGMAKCFRKILDLWFLVFPVWSLAFYIWFLWRVAPLGFVSPIVPVDHPHYISFELFWIILICIVLMFFTCVGTCFLLQSRIPMSRRRIAWMMLALLVPPLGCPIAYYATRCLCRHSVA